MQVTLIKRGQWQIQNNLFTDLTRLPSFLVSDRCKLNCSNNCLRYTRLTYSRLRFLQLKRKHYFFLFCSVFDRVKRAKPESTIRNRNSSQSSFKSINISDKFKERNSTSSNKKERKTPCFILLRHITVPIALDRVMKKVSTFCSNLKRASFTFS